MAGGHGLRSQRHRYVVDALSQQAPALLGDATGARSVGATMVQYALERTH